MQFNCRDLAFGRRNLRRVVPRRKGASDMTAGSKTILKALLLISASVGLSGCVYDLGLGYASDGYYNDDYGCDPYGGYDAYYDCDYGRGFANIGFGGGYYDNYYYPGYGFFLFDNVGRRYAMRDHHRRYWGEKRQGYFREQRGRDRDGTRYQRSQHGYIDDPIPGAHGWRDGSNGRAYKGNDDRHEGRRDGRRGTDDQWRGRRGGGANAVLMPIPGTIEPNGRGHDGDDVFERPDRRGDRSASAVTPPPAPAQQGSGASPSPPPYPERPPPPLRRGRDEGDNIRDE